MALRLLEIVLPEEDEKAAQDLLKGFDIIHFWHERGHEERFFIKLLLSAEKTEPVLDALEKRFSSKEAFRITLLPVEASIPRPEPGPEPSSKEKKVRATRKQETVGGRISREELYADIQDVAGFSKIYMVMVMLSSLVAAIGILRDNMAIIIGAMVIAPLLGPNVGLSLATALADATLARKALKTNISGILVVLAVSLVLGLVITFDPTIPEIVSRTEVGLGDIILALASGTAGTLAFTSGLPSTTLVGVMVAVALLPPLVTFGLLVGAGQGTQAMGAMLLFLTNLICVNLSGVATFLVQGIRPLSWWEAARATSATRKAMMLWLGLLLALVAIILFSRRS
jgi:uncharacterized hydrophobic protein (TIGR00341 family)